MRRYRRIFRQVYAFQKVIECLIDSREDQKILSFHAQNWMIFIVEFKCGRLDSKKLNGERVLCRFKKIEDLSFARKL